MKRKQKCRIYLHLFSLSFVTPGISFAALLIFIWKEAITSFALNSTLTFFPIILFLLSMYSLRAVFACYSVYQLSLNEFQDILGLVSWIRLGYFSSSVGDIFVFPANHLWLLSILVHTPSLDKLFLQFCVRKNSLSPERWIYFFQWVMC